MNRHHARPMLEVEADERRRQIRDDAIALVVFIAAMIVLAAALFMAAPPEAFR